MYKFSVPWEQSSINFVIRRILVMRTSLIIIVSHTSPKTSMIDTKKIQTRPMYLQKVKHSDVTRHINIKHVRRRTCNIKSFSFIHLLSMDFSDKVDKTLLIRLSFINTTWYILVSRYDPRYTVLGGGVPRKVSYFFSPSWVLVNYVWRNIYLLSHFSLFIMSSLCLRRSNNVFNLPPF